MLWLIKKRTRFYLWERENPSFSERPPTASEAMKRAREELPKARQLEEEILRSSSVTLVGKSLLERLNTFEDTFEGQYDTSARCLKITEKVSFNIASEASYVYILNGQK